MTAQKVKHIIMMFTIHLFDIFEIFVKGCLRRDIEIRTCGMITINTKTK